MTAVEEKPHRCGFCKKGSEVEDVCGKLWHNAEKDCTAHQRCMQYSAVLVQYKMKKFGGFKVDKVLKEQQRGRNLKCAACAKDKKMKKVGGATAGCAIARCQKTFHFYCAKTAPDIITRRIEMSDKQNPGNAVVAYRVFCNEAHQRAFEHAEKKSSIKYVDDTDTEEYNSDDVDDDSDDDDDDDDSRSSGSSTDSDNSGAKNGKAKKAERNGKKQSTSDGLKSGKDAGKKLDESPAKNKVDADFSDASNDTGKKSMPQKQDGFGASPDMNVSGAFHRKRREPGEDNSSNGEPGEDKDKTSEDEETTETRDGKRKLKDGADVSPDIKKMKTEGSDDSDLVYAVCFLEQTVQDAAKATVVLRKCAEKLCGVTADGVYLWKYNGRELSASHVVYLLNEISKTLVTKNETELHRLIFNVKDGDIDKFDDAIRHNAVLDAAASDAIYTGLRAQIGTNFKTANTQYSKCVGRYCLVKALDAHVGFVLLCNATDETGRARARMGGKPEEPIIFTWNGKIPLSRNIVGNNAEIRTAELEKLQHWMSANTAFGKIHCWPKETILRRSDFQNSVTCRLYDHFQISTKEKEGAHAAFIVPADSNLVNYAAYVRKRVSTVLDEFLTGKRDVYVVLDVGPELGISTFKDIVPNIASSIELEGFVAADPEVSHISAAILHFSLEI